ncbi:MAG: mandelate racemase/muconate lactonizing enzyme family protein [Methyloligellaceae bacterium]
MARVSEILLHRVDLPLTTPYRLSYRTFESFEPILVEVRDADGRKGLGEQQISPGSSAETREGGWAFAVALGEQIVGQPVDAAIARVEQAAHSSPVAATALATALEMLARPQDLETSQETRLPLLTPFNASEPHAIADEVEQRLDEGFRTFKVKVGKDATADLLRVAAIQQAAAGRATLRLDANRAFSRSQAVAFVASLDPSGIALMEQPCAADDWDANQEVALASSIPVMLDEQICALADIDRAAEMEGVGMCKVKLKRFVTLAGLEQAIARIKMHGLDAVLGDGLGAEINCWMEACVARRTIHNAGEFNGYLKVRPEARLLETPLPFENGDLVLPAGYWPRLDKMRLERQRLEMIRFAPTQIVTAQSAT